MNATEIKSALLRHYRFKRGFVTATEVSYGIRDIADILTYSDKNVSEIEVKCSISDLKQDFKKKVKHEYLIYDNTKLPNFIYFCVPEYLVGKVLPIMALTKYGLLSCNVKDNLVDHPDLFEIQIVKRAKRINKIQHDKMKQLINRRLSSELANIYTKVVCKQQKLFGVLL